MMTDRAPENDASRDSSGRCDNASPWLTVREAAQRARCGVKTIYREVQAGRLRAARIGGRRELRLLAEWVDAWLLEATRVTLV